ncbi:MAG: MATE family efflux transporter [Clostridia bacterium]|nr:MATE family efflux transporter [Clostridia bacterium]
MLPVVIALAWPTMLEELTQTAVQYIDTAMVGSLGTKATASVGATTTVNWLIGSTVFAFGVGFLAYISQAKGAGDSGRVRKASAQSVLAVIVIGAVFTAITLSLARVIPLWMRVDEDIRDAAGLYFFILYIPMIFRTASIIFGTVLRAVGDTKTPMICGITVNLLNVLLNFLFIYGDRTVTVFGRGIFVYGAGMGVNGAAVASAVSYAVGGILVTTALLVHPAASPKGESIKPDKKVLIPCLKVSMPNMLQRFGTSLGYVAFASMINSLGAVSTAAHTVANTVESAFYIPGYGIQTAAATLTGNAIGANDRRRQSDLAKTIIILEVFLMILSGALLFAFAPEMVRIFSKDEEVIRLGGTVLRMVACSEPFYGISIVTEGMLQGAGKTKVPFVLNVTGMWMIRILGTFICTQLIGLGLISAWACMIAHNLLLSASFVIYYRRTDMFADRIKA